MQGLKRRSPRRKNREDKMPGIEKAAFYNNPFIGLYLKASDRLALVPSDAPHKLALQAEACLNVPVERMLIDNSHLLGVMVCLNSNGAVLANQADKREVELLKKHGLNVTRLQKLAPGNNITANDKAAIASHRVTKQECREIEDCLGVEVHQPRFGGMGALASTTVATNRGALAYNELSETELKLLEKILGIYAMVGTSNLGVQFNALSITANSHGCLVGMQTTGFEMQRIYEALFG